MRLSYPSVSILLSTPFPKAPGRLAVSVVSLERSADSCRFPSPRYPASEPFPSLLSPIPPFPYPTPQPIQSSKDPPVPPHPLTAAELHLRLILNSIAEQVDNSWNDTSHDAIPGTNAASFRRAIPARDFMVIRIPEHEVTEVEAEGIRRAAEEADRVVSEWEYYGGLWVEEGVERR